MTKLERAKFRVKIRSLMEEARIIRHEEKRADRGPDHDSLHLHRVGLLRSEARSTQLAYAYYRGVPYTATETTNREVDGKRVRDIIRSLTYKQLADGELLAWLKGELCKT